MTIKYFTILLVICLSVYSCKKKSNDTPQPSPGTTTPTTAIITPLKHGKAVIHLHTFVGDEELTGFDNVVYLGERRISMTLGAVYISNIELVRMNGSIASLPDTVLLKEQDNISYYLNKVPLGKYKAIRFKVGLDSVASHQPVATAFGGILNKPELWFDSTYNPDKYVFAHFKGQLDTASTPDESNTRVDYEYKIGGKSHYVQVALPTRDTGTEFNITEVGSEYFHLYMDLTKLFEGIELNDPNNIKVTSLEDNTTTLSEKIATNISNMFRYE